ncbi:hypothetical protein K505DRAFT_12020 [Melanomma pulvis-pyrius CBS 109.77]|uniref:Uncharacterized protein n=1 Tax=Melanomma pulvis-pyrius CBS 109.77 TaxID=1314802 RepID=A0A6A6XXH8_9PLEO|nr:hypothetical protein K505DRAFT_12020 [Melanomma pulvis-pyrius CBS 109.77]
MGCFQGHEWALSDWFGIFVPMGCTICTVFLAGETWASRLRLFTTLGYLFCVLGAFHSWPFSNLGTPGCQFSAIQSLLGSRHETLSSPTTTTPHFFSNQHKHIKTTEKKNKMLVLAEGQGCISV